jgi:hypothetical protein
MQILVLALGLSVIAVQAMATEFVASGDWAPTRQQACEQATALATLRADAPISASSCICDKGDKRFSCLATVEVSSSASRSSAK